MAPFLVTGIKTLPKTEILRHQGTIRPFNRGSLVLEKILRQLLMLALCPLSLGHPRPPGRRDSVYSVSRVSCSQRQREFPHHSHAALRVWFPGSASSQRICFSREDFGCKWQKRWDYSVAKLVFPSIYHHPHSYVEVLKPSTSECYCIWTQDL